MGEEGCLDGGVCRTFTNGVSVRGSVLFTMGVCGGEWLGVNGWWLRKKNPPEEKRKSKART